MESLRATDPRQVGAYRLLGRLGAGGMGEVFLGESPGHRKVAVKLLRTEHAQDPQFRQRFAREVAAAKMVGGFHTAPVVDADPDGDPPWLVTAYISGPSLADAVKRSGPLDPEAVRLLGAALAEGLAAIHACGLVHRDLKPGNIILADDGPRIIDFGVARTPDASDLTSTGILVGTVSYMSPEQVSGERVDARSDVFSLGSVLAYAATGRSPFEAPTMPAIASRIVGGAPDTEGIAVPLRDTIAACLAKDPAARPTLDAVTASLTGAAHPDTYVPPPQTRYAERVVAPAPVTYPTVPAAAIPAPTELPRRSRGAPAGAAALSAAAVIVAAGVGVAAYLLTSGGGNNAGAGTKPSAGPAATSAPAAPRTLPGRYVGHWHGKLTDDAGLQGPTDATLMISGGSVGTDVGQAKYSGPGCTYTLQLVAARADRVTLYETVQDGPCVSEYVTLTPAPVGGLTDNVYQTLPGRGGSPTFTGHLSRDGSPAEKQKHKKPHQP